MAKRVTSGKATGTKARPRGSRSDGRRSTSAGEERRQVLVRLSGEMADYLDRVVPEPRHRAAYLRRLIRRDQARRERQQLAAMFAAAAADVSEADRVDRRTLARAFARRD